MKIPTNPFDLLPMTAAPVTAEVVRDFAMLAVETAFLVSNAVAADPTSEQSALHWQRLRRCLLVAAKNPEQHNLYLAIVKHPARSSTVPAVANAMLVDDEVANANFNTLVGCAVQMVYQMLEVPVRVREIQNIYDTLSKGQSQGTFGKVLVKS